MELPEDDQPPQSAWLDDEALVEHFRRVRDRYKSGGSGSEVVPELDQNELTKGWR